jgi:hypothetical protein
MDGARNLLQNCCVLDDSAVIIKWGAMANGAPRTWSSTSRLERRPGQQGHDGVESAFCAAVGTILATSAVMHWN